METFNNRLNKAETELLVVAQDLEDYSQKLNNLYIGLSFLEERILADITALKALLPVNDYEYEPYSQS